MKHVVPWLPPAAWMAVIFWFSSDAWSAGHTGATFGPLFRWLVPWATPLDLVWLHALARKTGHVVEYGILALLWTQALVRHTTLDRRWAAGLAFVAALAWAVADETHQAFVPSRTGSAADVAIDGAGALTAAALAVADWRRWVTRATGALLWMAAIGGVVMLAVDWLAGVPSYGLWITTSTAALVLALRFRARP